MSRPARKPRQQRTGDPMTAMRLLMPPARSRIVDESLRMNTALTMLAVHKDPGQDEWMALADAVNCLETLAVEMHRVSEDVLPAIKAATEAMAAAGKRWNAGKGMRLDGPGLLAVRDVVAMYEASLGELTAAEFDRMRQLTAERMAAFLLGRKTCREVISV